jgi:hypothetical protein
MELRVALALAASLAVTSAYAQDVTTIAGFADGVFSGDGGPATAAALHCPNSPAVARDGTIYFADSCNYRMRTSCISQTAITIASAGWISRRASSRTSPAPAFGVLVSGATVVRPRRPNWGSRSMSRWTGTETCTSPTSSTAESGASTPPQARSPRLRGPVRASTPATAALPRRRPSTYIPGLIGDVPPAVEIQRRLG